MAWGPSSQGSMLPGGWRKQKLEGMFAAGSEADKLERIHCGRALSVASLEQPATPWGQAWHASHMVALFLPVGTGSGSCAENTEDGAGSPFLLFMKLVLGNPRAGTALPHGDAIIPVVGACLRSHLRGCSPTRCCSLTVLSHSAKQWHMLVCPSGIQTEGKGR